MRPSENVTVTRSFSSWISLDRNAGAHRDTGTLGSRQQDFVQAQARQRAKRRHLLVAEQEFVLDDQLAAGIEDGHPVVGETRRQDFGQQAERIVDAQRIRRLAQTHARHIEGRPALDEHDLDAAPRESGGRRQAADAASDHQHSSNIVHSVARFDR